MDNKRPMNELADEITKLKKEITVGANYAHYKDPSKTYTVKGFAVIQATQVIGVVYQTNYGPKLTFVRPASEWLDVIDDIPRFRKLS